MSAFGNLLISEQVQVNSDIFSKRINSCTPTIANIPTLTDTTTVVANTDTVVVNFAAETDTDQEVVINFYNAAYPNSQVYIMYDYSDGSVDSGGVIYKCNLRSVEVATNVFRSLYVISRRMSAGSGKLPAGQVVVKLFGVHNFHLE